MCISETKNQTLRSMHWNWECIRKVFVIVSILLMELRSLAVLHWRWRSVVCYTTMYCIRSWKLSLGKTSPFWLSWAKFLSTAKLYCLKYLYFRSAWVAYVKIISVVLWYSILCPKVIKFNATIYRMKYFGYEIFAIYSSIINTCNFHLFSFTWSTPSENIL